MLLQFRPLISSPSIAPLSYYSPLIQYPKPFKLISSQNKPSNLTAHNSTSSQFTAPTDKPFENDWEFLEKDDNFDNDDEGCPWEGAIMYKRNASVSHLEYCTTLERLGLGKVSSEFSRTRASEMGLRVVKVKYLSEGTPVLVSVEVVRKKHKLRLDGIVRTVIALNCNRCGEPAAQSVYSNFSVLLCEEPIQEPEIIDMGVIFGESKSINFGISEGDDGEDSLIDLDDQLYFPLDAKVIDISKNIRDLIHVEINIAALCHPNCKGLCLKCGMNLNSSKCTCTASNVEEKNYGPLGNLRKQMQQS